MATDTGARGCWVLSPEVPAYDTADYEEDLMNTDTPVGKPLYDFSGNRLDDVVSVKKYQYGRFLA